MPTPTDIGTLIIQTPNIRGGRPHVAGTGVTVRRIIGWYKLGLSPEEIASELPHLSLAQIYAALAYYYEHQAEFEAEILRQAERAKAWVEAAKDSPLRQQLREQGLLP